jgi:membrane protein
VTIVGGALITQELAEQFGLQAQAFTVLQLLRWPAVFVALTLAVAILYRYAPSIVIPWRWILIGAAAFTLGWLAATVALGWYAGNVADYGATYGSLGAVIVLMLWFYITSALLLVGAELTAALARERTPDQIRMRGEEQQMAASLAQATDRATDTVSDGADRLT